MRLRLYQKIFKVAFKKLFAKRNDLWTFDDYDFAIKAI